MQSKFSAAIAQICEEKNIDKKTVLEAIEAAIAAAYRKDYGEAQQKVRVEFDEKTGFIRIFRQFDVVKTVETEAFELTPAKAKKIKKNAKVGDIVEVEEMPEGFGRIAAQTAKQVIIQRIREAEKEAIFNLYKDREGELLTGQVQRVEADGTVFLDLEKATVMMKKEQCIPHETFYNGQRIKVYIEKVARTDKGPQIIISRNHADMIQRLLELEVPEIAEATVIIKGVAREAGVRTKISVTSKEEGVDPVGSCVGQKGVRIQAVTDELSGERIDIVEWAEDPVTYLMNALAPAKIISIKLDEKKKLAKVYVTEDQRSLAIGKNGQNVRLASILTDWEIDIEDYIVEEGEEDKSKKEGKNDQSKDLKETKDKSQAVDDANKSAQPDQEKAPEGKEVTEKTDETAENKEIPLSEIKGLTKTILTKFRKAGIENLVQVENMNVAELSRIEGMDQKAAEKVIKALEKLKKYEKPEEEDE